MKRIAIVVTFILATVPVFAASAQPEQLSKKQLAALVATAKTPADHQRIAAWYRVEAQQLLAASNDHARMAAAFRSNPSTNNGKFAPGTVNHCAYLAQSLKQQSEKARALAEEHEHMAESAGQE
ncbi:MAG TPA: hypothetical protein VKR52_11700 [Terracidiphilus sp.]|nr:hypothetical protein [Terracidiphilus sp.]